MKNYTSLLAFFFCCIFILGVAHLRPKWKGENTNATISWDVSGYYSYLPATFIYKDIKKLSFLEDINEKYHPTSGYINAYKQPNGNQVIQYPLGMAVVYLPAFVAGHLATKLSSYPSDGYSYPYQFFLSWWSFLIAFVGLFFTRKNLRLYFSDRVVALCLIIIVLGTNYLNYTAFDHAMAHNYLFTIYALLFYVTYQLYKAPTYRKTLLIGILIGLAALIRPTEIISVLIPLFLGVKDKADWKNRLIVWQTHFQKIAWAFLLTFSIGCLQFVYWKYITGHFLFYSYEGQTFSWLKPHLLEVLFSYRKGWFTYTPLMLLAVLGFFPLYKNKRPVFAAICCFTLLNIYIVSAWDIWWYGGSFGQRAIVHSYAFLVFPLAACLEWLGRNYILKMLGALVILLGIGLNLCHTYHAQSPKGFLSPDRMKRAYYWRLFLNPNPQERDKFLLDINTDFHGQRSNVKKLYETDFELLANQTTSKQAHSGNLSTFTSNRNLKSLPITYLLREKDLLDKTWLRVGAYFYCEWKEWTIWKMPAFSVKLLQKDDVVKTYKIRPQRVFFEKKWEYFHMDFPIPEEPFDTIVVELDNAGKSSLELFMDDLIIESYTE